MSSDTAPTRNTASPCLRSLPAVDCILGNHDHAVAGAPYSMGREAQKVIEWTRKQLSGESLRFLKSLEASRNWGDMLFCHANPYRPLEWYYVEEREYIARSFSRSRAKSLFIGHTHVAAAITRRNFFCIHINTPRHNSVVPVAELNRQIFNCGSIGQPRDGDPRASYLIYDTDRQSIEFFRLDYDHERAAREDPAGRTARDFCRAPEDGTIAPGGQDRAVPGAGCSGRIRPRPKPGSEPRISSCRATASA